MKKNYLEPKLLTVHLSNTDIVTASPTSGYGTSDLTETNNIELNAPGYREFDY